MPIFISGSSALLPSACLIAAVGAVSFCALRLTPGTRTHRFVSRALLGGVCLFALSHLGAPMGCNALTVLAAGMLGMPGVALTAFFTLL